MNKKLRQLALLMLTLCFAGSMAFLACAESETVECPTCGEQLAEIVGKVDETCTEDGYTGDICCSNCHEVIKEGSAIAARHINGNEDTLEGIEFIWSGYGDTLLYRTVVTCLRCGEVTQDFACPEELIGSEIVQEATCTQNQIIRYWMTNDPECTTYPDYTVEIPDSKLDHEFGESGPSEYFLTGSYDNVKLIAKGVCKYCGETFEQEDTSTYISYEYLDDATCTENEHVRYYVDSDPSVKELVVEVPDSIKHDYRVENIVSTWSGYGDTVSLRASVHCSREGCDSIQEAVCPAEYISSEVVQEATCTQNQIVRYWMAKQLEYTIYPDYIVEIPDSKLDHEFDESNPTERFLTGSYDNVKLINKIPCKNCSEILEQEDTSTYISYEYLDDATCTENEHIRYYVSSDPSIKELVVEVPDSTKHDYHSEDIVYIWSGYEDTISLSATVSCRRDGCDAVLEETCPASHISSEVIQKATCYQNKIIRYWTTDDPECESVPEYIVEIPNSKVGHEGDDHGPYQFVWSIASRYPHTVSLKAIGRCKWCGEMVVEMEVPSEYIKYEVVKKETCTTNRIEHYWCTLNPADYDCELPDYTVEIPSTGMHHNATVWSYDIDFTSDTTATVEFVCDFICSECGHADGYHTVPVTVDAIEAKKPTCTSNGYVVVPEVSANQQTNGDKVTTILPIVRKGGTIELSANDSYHVPASERSGAVSATCTSNGYTGDLYCTECGKLIEAGKTVAALGHDYSSYYSNNDATCTSSETGTAYCSRCGSTDTVTLTGASGHKGTLVNAKAATCTTDGYTGDTVCSVCHKTLSKGTVISATGHSFTAVDEDYSICTLCGAEQGSPRLVTVEDVVVEVEVAEEQAESTPAASLVVRTTVAAPSTDSTTSAQTAPTTTTSESNVQILTIEYIPEVITEDIATDQQEESELTIKLPAEQVEGYVLYLVKEDGTKIEIPVVYENGKAVFKLNYRLNAQNNWVIRMVPSSQI